MALVRVSATASSVGTGGRSSALIPQQVKLTFSLNHTFIISWMTNDYIILRSFTCVSPGEILVQSSNGLDFEDSPKLRLVVKAETVSSTSFMAFNLILQDVNDNLPRFQLQNYVAYMREAQGYEMPIIQVDPVINTIGFASCQSKFSHLHPFFPHSFRWWLRMSIRARMVR